MNVDHVKHLARNNGEGIRSQQNQKGRPRNMTSGHKNRTSSCPVDKAKKGILPNALVFVSKRLSRRIHLADSRCQHVNEPESVVPKAAIRVRRNRALCDASRGFCFGWRRARPHRPPESSRSSRNPWMSLASFTYRRRLGLTTRSATDRGAFPRLTSPACAFDSQRSARQ